MSKISDRQIALIASGIKLLYELFGRLDETLLRRALRRKVPIPRVTRVPSWEDTESFITVNPDFLSTEDLRTWWDSRDQNQSRVRLMISLARELRREQADGIYLFAPEIRETAALLPVVMSVADDIKLVMDDPTLSKERRTDLIVKILEEAAQ